MDDVKETERPGSAEARGEARRRAFMDAARQVFLRDGYEAASVTEVVRIAGGSLATLYAQFGSKEGLFLAMAQERQKRLIESMAPARVDHLPIGDGLQVMGEHFLRAMIAPEAVAMFRVLLGEGHKFPEGLRRFISFSAEQVRSAVVAFLISHKANVPDPEDAASYFLDMLRGRYHFRALADPKFQLSDDDLKQHVAHVVAFFMAAVRP